MKNDLFRKGLVYGIIILFIGVSIPLTGSKIVEKSSLPIEESAPSFDNNAVVDASSLVIIIDGTMGDNGWFISCVTITIEVTNGNIPYIMYKIDDGAWTKYYDPVLVREDGEHTICGYYVDSEGNESETICIDFKIDQTLPTIELTVERIGFRKWLITADVYDETSGVNRVEFYINGEYIGEVTEAPYELVYTGTGYGLQIVVYDKAGNYAITCPVPSTRVFGIIPLTGSKSVDITPVSDDTAYMGNFYNRTRVSIYPPSQTVETGETFTASFYIEPADWIIGVNFVTISFDPTYLQANSVSKGTFFNGNELIWNGGTIDNVAGTISDGFALVLAGNAVNTPGSEFVISFTAQQLTGTTVIHITGAGAGYEPPEVRDGNVTILNAAPPEINNVMLTASNPLDTEPGFGWERVTCTVTDNLAVDEVKLVVTKPDTTTIEYPMNKDGDTYSYETTFTQPGNYSYHIWAADHSFNNATSSPEQFFLPMNWDVDMDGRVYFEDLIAIVLKYGMTGPPGWVREDINNVGWVYFDDFTYVVLHYGEGW